MLKCPKCKSENINQFKTLTGKIWCNRCCYQEDNKESYNPFIVNETRIDDKPLYNQSKSSSKIIKENIYSSFEDDVKDATKKLNKNMRIDQMQNVRSKNNDNWMDLLRLALKYAPEKTKKVLQRITDKDKEISRICEKIINDK